MSLDLQGMLGELAAEQMEKMTAQQDEFGKRMTEQQKVVDLSANRIMERFTRRRPPGEPQAKKYSPEVEKIADFLTAFPKLIPVVNNVIVQVTAAMESAFDNVAAKYNPPTAEPAAQTQGAT